MNGAENKREEIAERFFEELKDTFFFQVHRVQKNIFRRGNNLMQESGLDLQMEQLPVLMTIHVMKSVSQREIADIIMRDKSSIQRSVVALQRKGLVSVEQDSVDKRKNIVTLTPDGIVIAQKTKLFIRKSENDAFARFSAEERDDAIKAIKDVADRLEK